MSGNHIKSITAWTYYSIENELNKFISSYREYDENGNLLEEADYLAKDELETRIVYSYDDSGRLKQKTNYYGDNEPAETTYYIYDANGKLIKEEVLYPDESRMIKTYDYNPDNHAETITILDENKRVEEKEVNQYDEKGKKIIANESYDSKNKLKEKTVYAYDENERLVEETNLTKKGKVRYKKNHIYDEAGNLIKTQTINKKGRIIDIMQADYDDKNRRTEILHGPGNKIRYEYQDNKRIIKVQEIINGRLENERVLKYNPDGYLIEEREGSNKTSYVYNFFNNK